MFSNMQAILANLVVPVVRLLLFIAAYAAIKFIQTKAAIYKAKKEAKIRDQEHAARIRRAKRAVKELSPDLKEAADRLVYHSLRRLAGRLYLSLSGQGVCQCPDGQHRAVQRLSV